MAKDIIDYIAELNTLRVQLAKNLSSKGANASEDEGFETLIPKVLDADENASLKTYGNASPLGSIANLIYAVTSHICKTGSFTLTEPIGTVGMTIDTGLEHLYGFMYWIDESKASAKEKGVYHDSKGGAGGLILLNEDEQAVALQTVTWDSTYTGLQTGSLQSAFYFAKSWSVANGKIKIVPSYAGNAEYTPFFANAKYMWLAW